MNDDEIRTKALRNLALLPRLRQLLPLLPDPKQRENLEALIERRELELSFIELVPPASEAELEEAKTYVESTIRIKVGSNDGTKG